ncbi:MAG: hypothetical protein CMB99_04495 [Flavobacteriaceae bacterium]|nr:hypothetical protein [Flavobacteriaceae bacterium]
MKWKPVKIGQLTLTPKMQLGLIGALFIIGVGIGSMVASSSDSKFGLYFCIVIAFAILLFTFRK